MCRHGIVARMTMPFAADLGSLSAADRKQSRKSAKKHDV